MPLFDYVCRSCNYTEEVLLSLNEKYTKECPKCKATKLEKQVGLSSFHLKGTGWYKDGYSSKPSSERK